MLKAEQKHNVICWVKIGMDRILSANILSFSNFFLKSFITIIFVILAVLSLTDEP